MAGCWVVAMGETGVGSRADWMAVKMAAERALKMAVNYLWWMAAQMTDCLAEMMVLTKIVSAVG